MTDLIETLLGIAPDSTLGALRRRRPEALRHAEGAYRELVLPAEPGRVSHAERAAIAFRVAVAEGDALLAGHFRGLLQAQGADALIAAAEARDGGAAPKLAALLRYADLVGSRPGECTQADIDALSALGLDAQDIVAVTQLVSFVPYQVRLLAGLRALMHEAAA